jgi:uncharacterized protein
METLTSVKNEQNIRIAQKGFADFLNGNIQGVLDACTDNVVWGSYDNSSVPFAGLYHGKKGVGEFFSSLAQHIDYKEFAPGDYFADNNHVFVKGHQHGVIKSTGKSFGHDFVMEFQISDGKVSSFFAYVDTRDQSAAFVK